MKKITAHKTKNIVVWCVMLCLFGAGAAFAAFTPKTDLFSATKDTPLGFSNLVEPNVLILIDTSGSMAYKTESDSSTDGDGSKPYIRSGNTYRYFGKDNNPGNNKTDNNDASVDFNYHPLLRYIPDDIISDEDNSYTSYLSYDRATKTKERWVEGSWKYVGENDEKPPLPDDRQWAWQSNRWVLQRRTGNSWRNINNRNQIPSLLSGFRYVYNSSSNHWLEAITEGFWENYNVNAYLYKYPNDSRLYILKNVMYRILSDSTLVQNLRIGLASYYQEAVFSNPSSNFYRNKGTLQSISWKGSLSSAVRKRALLRRDFRSTETEGHVEKLKEWFDGTEDADNPEFRAHGATPLASSIYGADRTANLTGVNNEGKREGSAADFFTMNDPYAKNPGTKVISDWCQDNWLIVLTDGADSYVNATNTALAARNLFNTSITVNGKPSMPIKTFVIGMVDPSEMATLKNTLNNMADYGDDGLLNKSATAYFPQNMQDLFDAFSEIFQKIQDFSATSSAPLVNPPRTVGGEGEIYITGFKPKAKQQWTGYFYSHVVSDDAVGIPHRWEAGNKLRGTAYSDRKIYTADWNGRSTSGLSGSNLKNFSSTQVEALRPLLAGAIGTDVLSNAKLGQFINWVRGLDVWDETDGTERWKLGDPYHVGLVEIGAPQGLLKDQAYHDFKEQHKNRGKFVYLHANDGMLHSFASETNNVTVPRTVEGLEKWAFIPPNVLGYRRLIGTKIDGFGKWIENEKHSFPRYLLDGPLVAEDVYIDGEYRTVLVGSLGLAGAGMYALDVTDPSLPQFLWAFENNFYDQASMAIRPRDERTFLRWVPSMGSATAELTAKELGDSSSLGRLRLTVSTPFLGSVDIKSGVGSDVNTKWVALFGAGVQNSYSDTDAEGGKAVYIVDIENADLIKELTHAGLGMATAPLSIEAGPRPLRIKNFYLGDHKGAVFEGNATDLAPSNWSLNRVFNPGNEEPAGIPFSIEIGLIKNRKWLFWGTGDPDGLFGTQTGQNRIVALNRSNAGTSTTFANLESLDKETDNIAQGLNGWYMNLASSEMVTTPPLLYRGYLFIATYKPVLNDNCSIGNSNLYILKADSGLGGWVDEMGKKNKYVTLEATRISGITISGGKVYIGATRYPGASETPPVEMGNVTFAGNLMVVDVPEQIMSGEGDDNSGMSSKSTRPTYWRDWRP
jgi:type IV pilus assembly protein PilY1